MAVDWMFVSSYVVWIFLQLWTYLDCKFTFWYLGLTISHHKWIFSQMCTALGCQVGSLYFRGWDWDGFTIGLWIFSRVWMAQDWNSAFSWLDLMVSHGGATIFTCVNGSDWMFVSSYLGLTTSHLWCECFHNCEQLWIESLYFIRGSDELTHTSSVNFSSLCEQLLVGSLYFCGWI